MNRKYFIKSKAGMTLIEILVSIIILSIVLLAAGAVYLSGVKELVRIIDDRHAQTEAYFVLDHMHKNVMGAVGITALDAADNPIAWPAPPSYPNSIRVDLNHNLPLADQIKYCINTVNNTVEFYPEFEQPSHGSAETIAKYVTSLKFGRPLSTETPAINNYITIEVTTTKGKMQRTFSTGVAIRGMSPSAT